MQEVVLVRDEPNASIYHDYGRNIGGDFNLAVISQIRVTIRAILKRMLSLALSPGHSQILSHSCGEKPGVAWGRGYAILT